MGEGGTERGMNGQVERKSEAIISNQLSTPFSLSVELSVIESVNNSRPRGREERRVVR